MAGSLGERCDRPHCLRGQGRGWRRRASEVRVAMAGRSGPFSSEGGGSGERALGGIPAVFPVSPLPPAPRRRGRLRRLALASTKHAVNGPLPPRAECGKGGETAQAVPRRSHPSYFDIGNPYNRLILHRRKGCSMKAAATSRKALAGLLFAALSVYLGVFSDLRASWLASVCLGVISVVLGAVGLRDVIRSEGRLRGECLANTVIVVRRPRHTLLSNYRALAEGTRLREPTIALTSSRPCHARVPRGSRRLAAARYPQQGWPTAAQLEGVDPALHQASRTLRGVQARRAVGQSAQPRLAAANAAAVRSERPTSLARRSTRCSSGRGPPSRDARG